MWFANALDQTLDNFGGGSISGGEGFSGQAGAIVESGSALDPSNMTSNDGSRFWQGLTPGASQDSRVTFTNVHTAVHKPHSNGVWSTDSIQVLYDVPNQRIQIYTYAASPASWIQQGTDIASTFADGDVFSARALTNGTVEIYRNGTLFATRPVTQGDAPQHDASFQWVLLQVQNTDTPTPTLTPTPTASPTLPPPPSGPITINYIYDPLNRLTEANYSNGDYYHYAYDAVGNRETQDKFVLGFLTSDSYLYDDANQLASLNGVSYTWDNNGNLLNDGVNAYIYDSANRLKGMSNQSTVTSYQYNGLNDRLQETVNGSTTIFTMDLNTGLTQALSDGTNAYIYGNGRIAQVGTGTEYFLGDALGSVRQLTNASGAITYAKAYDPYGVVTAGVGTSQSAYGYTNEYTSQGLIYLRARMYDPATGRFTTKDLWEGDYERPLSLNLWLYTEGNPVNRTDPSGQCYVDTGNLPKGEPWKWEWRVWEYPILGPCQDHSGPISPDQPHWHEYSVNSIVCPAWLSCSEAEIADAMIRFAYPGQKLSEPIQDREFYFVVPFKGTSYEALGAIQSFVSQDHLTTANVALPTHIFYAGRIDRQAKQSANGEWHVITHGTGNNIYFAMDTVNQETGADIFKYGVDVPMEIYILEQHFINWLKRPC